MYPVHKSALSPRFTSKSSITFSYKKAEDKEGLEESEIKFHGFDGNDEGNQFGYALYFVVDLGRFTELTGGEEYPDLNSH
ncbi:MAG: YfbU family protein, partial [Spirochaetes bacterium]|nr:YfbU family protein [Spirochaetota bacterium]